MADTKISALTELAQSVIDSANDLLVGVDVSDTTMNATGTNKKLTLKSAVGASIQDLAQTWNDSGTTFTGLKLNVTDTASDSSSLLMDLQVGGSSKFSVSKAALASFESWGLRLQSGNYGVGSGGTRSYLYANGNPKWTVNHLGQAQTVSGGSIGFSSGSANATDAGDTFLYRDAANTLAQRNSTNPQAFNIYNTYTDASNYERGYIKWISNALRIGAEVTGTGTARWMHLENGNTRITIRPNDDIYFDRLNGRMITLGSGGVGIPAALLLTNYTQITEINPPSTPAANSLRVYAEDDGSSNTQLSFLFSGGETFKFRSTGFMSIGGTTSSYPALKQDGTTLKARLADDSGDADFTAASVSASSVDNSSLITGNGYNITGSNSINMVDLSGTWNTTGTPTLIKANVTDTASNANSLVLDLQVDSTSVFSVGKQGEMSLASEENVSSVYVDGYVASGVSAVPMLDLNGTWNTTGTPTLIKADVTDTASASGSLLIDLQVDSSSVFSVDKGGKISTSGSSDTSSIVANGYSVTGSGETPLMDLSGTWNTTGEPTLIKANITDTASASGSSLIDLQVGGTSKFRVEKDGTVYSNVEFILAASDEISDLSTGTAKVSFRAPFAFDVIDVRGSVGTAPSGSPIIVDINENGSSILSSELFIDSLEKTSLTSASGVVISDGAIADDAEITIDIDQVGSGVAGKGLKITLYGTRA